jgi:hypothetical protein
MAISATHLTTNQSGSSATSYNTASITPSANKLVLIAVGHQITASAPVVTPTVSGCGLTWVEVATKPQSAGSVFRRITVFRAMGASPSTGALTIDFGAQSQLRCGWSVSEFDGVDTSGTNGSGAIVQSASNDVTDSGSATGVTVTLSAFSSANNATYGALRYGNSSDSASVTEGSGFTRLGLVNGSASYGSMYKLSNDTSVDWTWNSTTTFSQAIALEIKAASVTPSNTGAFLAFM